MDYIPYLVSGLVTGTILLLGTVGFSLVKRIENFLNIAHGQVLTLGAYLGYTFNVKLGWNIFLSFIAATLVTTLVGWLIFKVFYKPIRSYGNLYLLFTSVGVAYIIHGAIEAFYGVQAKTYSVPVSKVFEINGIPIISGTEAAVIVLALGSAFGLHLFLTRTLTGKAIRAMASNLSLANARGIDTEKIASVAWLLSSALGAMAGIFSGLIGTVYTDMGWAIILLILSAAVLGGLGSLYGVMIGAMIIGLSMDLSVIILPASYRPAVAFAMVIVVLLFKPQGILGGEGH
ncbi:branched-chain amino acid ABC transporter permease [Paradesulfitobacterium aromaticivorans]